MECDLCSGDRTAGRRRGLSYMSSLPGEDDPRGGALFLGIYAVFILGLVWTAPGCIAQVWNLPALSGVYEHFAWT